MWLPVRQWMALLSLAAVSSLGGGAVVAEDPLPALDRLALEKRGLRELSGQIDQVRQEIESLEKRYDFHTIAIAESRRALEETEREIDGLWRSLDGQWQRYQNASLLLGSTHREMEGATALLARQLRWMARHRADPYWKVLLAERNQVKLIAEGSFTRRMVRKRIQHYRRLQTAFDAAEAARERVLRAAAEQESRLATLQAARGNLSRSVADGGKTDRALQDRLRVAREQRALLEKSFGQIFESIRSLMEERSRQQGGRTRKPEPGWEPFQGRRGDLPWPVELTSEGRAQAAGGLVEGKVGLVVPVEPGAPVYAVHAGAVLFADWLRGFGNLIVIAHGRGYLTLYANLSQTTVRAGEVVEAGQRIGYVGDEELPGHPALSFQIRHAGEAEDAMAWLRRR